MVRRALTFLNLLDNAGNLSLTNIAVIVGLAKMAFSHQMTSCDSVALVGTLLNYAHKRFTNDNASSN